MNPQKIQRQFIMPTVVPIIAFVIAAVLIVIIGEVLLRLNAPGRSELERPELWVATGLSLLILAAAAAVMSRPKGSLGPLDADLAFGDRPILDPPPPPLLEGLRSGEPGTVADIAHGYTLYTRTGALARVVDVLPNVTDYYGHLRQGLIYAKGLYGADKELWIPVEAVSAVYPENKTAVLAIAADATAALGWNRPPQSFVRKPAKEEPKLH